MDKLVECSFLIPILRDSDKKTPHQPICWQLLLDALRRLFPEGHSGPKKVILIEIDLVKGEYSDESGRTEDESRKYTVAITKRRLHQLRRLLKKTANTFDQRAIYLSVKGEVEFIIPGPEDGFLGDDEN